MNPPSIAVIYDSATGNVHQLARAVAEAAADAGAQVRLRRVAELAPDYAIDTNPAWRAHLEETKDTIEEATLDDLDWADGPAAPARMTAQVTATPPARGPTGAEPRHPPGSARQSSRPPPEHNDVSGVAWATMLTARSPCITDIAGQAPRSANYGA